MSGTPPRRLFVFPGRPRAPRAADGTENATARWRAARLATLGAGLAAFSHDMRGVLAPALLAAERLHGHADPQAQRAGAVLLRAAERAMALLHEQLGPLREGLPVPARQPVAVRATLVEAAAGRLDLTAEFPADYAVEADPAYLRQAAESLFDCLGRLGITRAWASASVESRICAILLDTGRALTGGDPFTLATAPDAALDGVIARELVRACGGELGMADISTVRLTLNQA